MKLGDILEIAAAACFIAAAYLATRELWPALLTGGACLVYFAQCYASHSLKLRLPRLLKRNKVEEVIQ